MQNGIKVRSHTCKYYLSLASRCWAQVSATIAVLASYCKSNWHLLPLHVCVHLLGFLAVSMHRLWNSQTLLPLPLHYLPTDVNILCDIQHLLIHHIGGCCQELLQFKGDHLVVFHEVLQF